MIVSVAAVPHPPLLVPELATGPAADLAGVRAACATAVRELVRPPVEQVLVVGSGARTDTWGPGDHGTFAGYGRDLPVGFPGAPAGRVFTDLSLLVAAWLLAEVPVPCRAVTVPVGMSTEECLATGRRLAADTGRRPVGLLVLGDGAARRAIAEPGAPDAEADAFDAAARRALAEADPTGLSVLDPDLARRVEASGRAPWQVLAGATADRRWAARLHYAETPVEVTYLVATWRPQ